jgi:hypothetical protein
MRKTLIFLVVLHALTGCGGSLVERWDAGVVAGPDGGFGGLVCLNDDPCTCEPCSNSSQCAPGQGLSCMVGRRKGVDCPGGMTVCLK